MQTEFNLLGTITEPLEIVKSYELWEIVNVKVKNQNSYDRKLPVLIPKFVIQDMRKRQLFNVPVFISGSFELSNGLICLRSNHIVFHKLMKDNEKTE